MKVIIKSLLKISRKKDKENIYKKQVCDDVRFGILNVEYCCGWGIH